MKMEALRFMIKPCFLVNFQAAINTDLLSGKTHLAHHHLYNQNVFHLHYSEFALLQIIFLIITTALLLTTIVIYS